MKSNDGTVISCWKLSPEELKEVQRTGRVYVAILTFNNPLQPLKITAYLDELVPLKNETFPEFPPKQTDHIN